MIAPLFPRAFRCDPPSSTPLNQSTQRSPSLSIRRSSEEEKAERSSLEASIFARFTRWMRPAKPRSPTWPITWPIFAL